MLVDSHCHASRAWFEPVEPLIAEMDLNGISHAVLIQIHGQYDNSYQAECVARYSDRLVSVPAMDPKISDPKRALAREKDNGARGIRLRLPSRENEDGAKALWRAAAELALPVSLSGTAAEFGSDECAALIVSYPGMPIVIEHLGTSTSVDRNGVPDETRRRILALANHRNAYMKIHGIGEFARRAMPVAEPFPFEQPIPPRLHEAYDAFGAERIMWGSNYPPVSALEGYTNSLRLTMEQFFDVSEAERQSMFGGTAARVFGLPKAV